MSEIIRTEETNISTINYTMPISDELIDLKVAQHIGQKVSAVKIKRI